MYITASNLYDYLQCKHRIWRDKHGPLDERNDDPNPFIELLWEKGLNHEREIIANIGEYLLIEGKTWEEKFKNTQKAMNEGIELIYQGVIIAGELLGIPDLLRKTPTGYVAVDIKSGRGSECVDEEGDEGTMKKHYAIQLCLYTDVLIRLGHQSERRAYILDINSEEHEYDLTEKFGPKSPSAWELYETTREEVKALILNIRQNKPALSSICGLCRWYASCKKWCEANHDLSILFNLGMSKRDVLTEDLEISKVEELANIDVTKAMADKKQFGILKGIAEKTLTQFQHRATIKTPELKEDIYFPKVSKELFFDIEDDPTQEFVYLHGVYERSSDGKKEYIPFVAKEHTKTAEKEAWAGFWAYINSLPKNEFAVYYYSPHEKTIYRKLRELYPDVISQTELEAFFDNPNVIDLYNDVVRGKTEWPLSSYGVKAIATYLGFKWRDETPSGALSIK
ncbi:TM0106 family RecB-like putative nuclease [Patescibacteria group bacterium]|nr:TM0106 family RecB-like putative nuclease [Patescibacteria group bacterium]MBU1016223.1 TM0106 family RecB-like putative nuclease [Patescibacteria group bacterium]MBU1684660.1 TM0106 family RecB-like putative nuclease [Patescibacteria group bacterium]MBU1938911.1 TM0106 family RecB-like putative nuclease [Patescibacteria group bacterium]